MSFHLHLLSAVCCYPWFSKLALRETLSPPTCGGERRVIPTDGKQLNLLLTDLLCATEYQTAYSFIWKSKRGGWSHGFAAEQRLFAVVAIHWEWAVSSLLDPITQMKSDGADSAKIMQRKVKKNVGSGCFFLPQRDNQKYTPLLLIHKHHEL